MLKENKIEKLKIYILINSSKITVINPKHVNVNKVYFMKIALFPKIKRI